MKRINFLLWLFLLFHCEGFAQAMSAPNHKNRLNWVLKDTLTVSGQFSSWGLYNHGMDEPLFSGARYIPALNYSIMHTNNRQIDFEGSANILGTMGIEPFDKMSTNGSIQPYRLWARYSGSQIEIRVGLQKINFGSATLLRPLMWFDQLDPRDPLQLTNGVWGALGRYYFLNNSNIWLWGLYGNKKNRPWDADQTNAQYPEFGGRFQSPVPKGEVALSFHHRVINLHDIVVTDHYSPAIDENRIGLDGKWDFGVGLWFEGTYVNKSTEVGKYPNMEIINVGADNTFAIGNGLNVVFEQLLFSFDQRAFSFSNPVSYSGLSLSYPISLIDNLSFISYFDWTSKSAYNFVNLKRQFNKLTFYFMAFWNPKNYQLPQQLNSGNYYSGRGIQLMLVYNH